VIYHDDNYPGLGPSGNGVIMADGFVTASYNALNQPVAMWSASTPDFMWFGYDPLGRCVKRTIGPSLEVGTTTYLYYDGWNLVQEGPSGASPTRVYAHGARVDEIIASSTQSTGQIAYHHYDAQGNCIALTDSVTGNIIEQYDYEAFGKPSYYDGAGNSMGVPTWKNRFLFTGREWLSELRLYDYRNRMYQPELGRFMQPDPKEFAAGDYNLYRYCHNDPVNKTDPTGLDTLIIWNTQFEGSRNVFGHIALATTGQGVQSVGNGDNAGRNYSHASTTSYLASQAMKRDTLLFTVRTTVEQEQKINAYFDSLANVKSGNFADNCATRTSEALRAAGLDIKKTHTPQSVYEQAKRVLGGTQSTIEKGETDKAQRYSSFDRSGEGSGNSRLVTPTGSHIPIKVDDD
jgi:RHS repeat-associated protein